VTSDYPIRDRAFLPPPLREPCSSLPLMWLETVMETTQTGTGIVKRDISFSGCFNLWGVNICWNVSFG